MQPDFKTVRNLMIKDNYLDQLIIDFEAEHKRDITENEENQLVLDMVKECKERMEDCSYSIVEAYKDIMEWNSVDSLKPLVFR